MQVQPEGLSGDGARLRALAGELDTIRAVLAREIAADEGWERDDEAGRQLAESLEPNGEITMDLFSQVVTQLSGTADDVEATGRLAAETDGGMKA
ncbi:hypothetical protein FE391_39750 [Nonomuraea sp. KC401]|uniref:hypothetical protein n=1 Tax=unclassified Nonomuraea TaxID=2593643 RepID=UPI0010FF3D18|nr:MULTISPECIES: hypothetical protein [unclassified Nonomuraea]NBE93314.1 hypothetical protein [Nonomuraea sp. K271]TLF56200.1 hypothetical protein FE391_39750 [Nonomuraea sp. KC401]